MRFIVIECANEYVKGAGVPIGAAGSYSDIALKIKFSDMWDGMSKHITWLDANGENPTIVYLTAQNYDGEYYTSLIPAEAKAVAGTAVMSIKGADSSKGTLTAKAEFKVLESVYDENAEEAVQPTPTVADQLQAQVEEIIDTIADARAAATEAAASQSAAETSAADALTYRNEAGGFAIEAASAASNAALSETAASNHAASAASSASAADGSATAAAASEVAAAASETAAAGYESNAAASAASASASAVSAAASKVAAAGSESAAEGYASDAASSEYNAGLYASAASGSATEAASSASSADEYASDSEAYAKGTRDGEAVTSMDPAYHANSKYYSEQASGYAANALSYKADAAQSASDASGYATAASGSASDASGSATAAAGSASDASGYATAASGSASDASGYATAASGSANTASGHAAAAYGSASAASASALDAEAAARGTRNGVAVGSSDEFYHDNAKYWKDQAEAIVGPAQPKITAVGILKGDGDGGITAAVAGTDYQAAGNYMRKAIDYVTAGQTSGTTLGSNATAEGYQVIASGSRSHAEGWGSNAFGDYSHAEGSASTLGWYSHAEGNGVLAVGTGAHAEGRRTNYFMNLTGSGGATTYTVVSSDIPSVLFSHIANKCYMMDDAGKNLRKITAITLNAAETAIASITLDGTLKSSAVTNWPFDLIFANTLSGGAHSEGVGTIALDQGSHAGGKHNIPVEGAEVIGGGTAENPANIRVLDWSGNETLAGKLTLGADPSANMDAATKQYVDTNYQAAGDYMVRGTDYVTAGQKSGTTVGTRATAEGEDNYAIGTDAHAEGTEGYAIGDWSHSEGKGTSNYNSVSQISVTGAADTKTYTMASPSSLPRTFSIVEYNGNYAYVTSVDDANSQFSISESISDTALSNESINLISSRFTESNDKRYIRTNGPKIALGSMSHIEGVNTMALNNAAHAEGQGAAAVGKASHAEGMHTVAAYNAAHAEGVSTFANAGCSHTEGYQTVANSLYQHVFGKFNIADNTGNATTLGTYVEIVGNGTSSSDYSNARTLDWSGNEVLAGKLTVGADPTNNMDVATKQYVDGAIPSVPSGSSTSPAMDGTAAAGTETTWAHGDHVHPTDTSRQAKITATGMLKGDGAGGVTAAVAGTDYAAASHNHDASDITSGTLGVAQGGTGAASFTANSVVMSGSSTTAALTTRAVTNNTAASTALTASTNIPTVNTLVYGLNRYLNRSTLVNAADTGYTTYMARGEALNSADTNPTVNGAISWTYA